MTGVQTCALPICFPVTIIPVFDGLKKAGLTAAKTVGEWVGIGKGEAKPYTLKINGTEKKVKLLPQVTNGFPSHDI